MRRPVILTTLEEDFKILGLVDDKPPTPEVVVATEEDDLEEGRRRVSGKGMSKRTKRMSGKEKAKSRSYERGHKQKRKRSRKKRAKSGAGKRLSRFNKRFEAFRSTLRGGKLAGLFEEVDEIMASLDEDTVDTAIKSFANIAIISEYLSEFFEAVLEEGIDDDDLAEELSEAAEFFDDLSESAAGIATALNEGEDLEVTLDEIEEAFTEQMESLVEGLELYADLTEDDDLDDEDFDAEDDDELEESVSVKARMRAKLGKK